MLSVTVEFSTVMLVATEIVFMVSLRQWSVGSYCFALLGSHILQALVTCLALCHIVLDELLHFAAFWAGVSLAIVSLAYFS